MNLKDAVTALRNGSDDIGYENRAGVLTESCGCLFIRLQRPGAYGRAAKDPDNYIFRSPDTEMLLGEGWEKGHSQFEED